MYKNLRWKFLTIAVVAGLATWAFTPPSQKIRLGLDLKGGIHLVLAVKTEDALRVETETSSEQLRALLKDQGIVVGGKIDSLTQFTVDGVPAASDQQFRTLADQQLATTFDRDAAGGGVYTFKMKPNVQVQRRAESVTQAIQTVERRVNELGVSEPVVSPYGTSGDQIIVQLPGLQDVTRAKNIISNVAMLTLKIVEGGPAPDQASLLASHNGVLPDDLEIIPGVNTIGGNQPNLVRAMNILDPTTQLLMKYSPSYTCLFQGAQWFLENGGRDAIGGNGKSVIMDAALLMGDDPYRYPDNLPIVNATGGPGAGPPG